MKRQQRVGLPFQHLIRSRYAETQRILQQSFAQARAADQATRGSNAIEDRLQDDRPRHNDIGTRLR
ncbi:hypothetical protein D3C76_1689400 [compost metagenome]